MRRAPQVEYAEDPRSWQYLPFKINYVSSQYHRNPAKNLSMLPLSVLSSASEPPATPSRTSATDMETIWQSRGWLSEQYGRAYQEIVFRFEQGVCRVRRLRIVSHETCISTKIEVSAAVGESRRKATFRPVGNIFFSDNKHTQYRAREQKRVTLDATANLVRLRLFEAHQSQANTFDQVGLIVVEFEGLPGRPENASAEQQVRDRFSDAERAKVVRLVGRDRWLACSWEQRLELLLDVASRGGAGTDDKNLPAIFSRAGVDWEKHAVNMSLTQALKTTAVTSSSGLSSSASASAIDGGGEGPSTQPPVAPNSPSSPLQEGMSGMLSPSPPRFGGYNPNTPKGLANQSLPSLPGLMSEVDRVLQGLGLPLDLVRNPTSSLAANSVASSGVGYAPDQSSQILMSGLTDDDSVDPTTRRLLEVVGMEKEQAVSEEAFEKAAELTKELTRLRSVGTEMQRLQRQKEYAVLRSDYKSAHAAKTRMEALRTARETIGNKNPQRTRALHNTEAFEATAAAVNRNAPGTGRSAVDRRGKFCKMRSSTPARPTISYQTNANTRTTLHSTVLPSSIRSTVHPSKAERASKAYQVPKAQIGDRWRRGKWQAEP